jgi:hypothetical protein
LGIGWVVATCVALAPRPASAAATWTRVESANPPPARFDHTITLEPATQKLVLFGGRTGQKTLGDTWIYDLSAKAWHEVKATTAPEARFGHAAAYDPRSRRVLLFAGQAVGFFNDVWAFDTIAETWQKLETKGTAPSKRYGTAAAVDTKRNQLIISHGFTDSGRFDDTLALDLTTLTWSKLVDANATRPLKRCLHDAVYEPTTDRFLLFGGCSSGFGPCPQSDFWSLNIGTRAWTKLEPTDRPTARQNSSMVSNDAGRVWLFGGDTERGADADTWTFDAATGKWSQVLALAVSPAPRSNHDATWNPAAKQMLLFGGIGDDGVLNDLWVFTP